MTTYAEMPIDQSPWADRQDAEDLDNYIRYYRGIASGIADLLLAEDSNTAVGYINGAQNALARFNITTRAHKKTKKTTFRFADQKIEGEPMTVFIVADASRINAQKDVLGLIQWCMLQEWKRSPYKHVPCYLLADECTNFKINDLGSLLTWGRGYGIRIHLVIQSLAAFIKVYGKQVLDIVLSETEIKQFLAGQREPETLSLIERTLAMQSVVAEGHRGKHGGAGFDTDGVDYKEDGRPLMTADEIRRTDKTILIIRKNKPLLTDLPPIGAIHPWRDQIGINPFHGKPFLLPIILRLKRRGGPVKRGILRRLRGFFRWRRS